jgi:hypothetical protein
VKKIYFPGWVVKVNGQPIDFSYQKNGFFNFKVGEGASNVQIIYEGTRLVRICNIVSAVAWLSALVYFILLIINKLSRYKNKKETGFRLSPE